MSNQKFNLVILILFFALPGQLLSMQDSGEILCYTKKFEFEKLPQIKTKKIKNINFNKKHKESVVFPFLISPYSDGSINTINMAVLAGEKVKLKIILGNKGITKAALEAKYYLKLRLTKPNKSQKEAIIVLDEFLKIYSEAAEYNFLKVINETRFYYFSVASWNCYYDPLEQFLENGFSANSLIAERVTPLIRAINLKRVAIVELLLKHGANPKLEIPDGMTTLDFTNWEISKIFEAKKIVNSDSSKPLKSLSTIRKILKNACEKLVQQ